MSRTLFKQNNGKYAVYSSISDCIIFYDMTKEEYIDMMLSEYKKELLEEFDETELHRVSSAKHKKGMPNVEDIKVFPYNWTKRTLKKQCSIMQKCGFSKEYIENIKNEWNHREDEDEDE